MEEIIKNSIYWKEEIDRTQELLAQLLRGDTAGVKSAKTGDDTITYQDIGAMAKECRIYLAYCQEQYDKALEEEGKKYKTKNKSILYFPSSYGY